MLTICSKKNYEKGSWNTFEEKALYEKEAINKKSLTKFCSINSPYVISVAMPIKRQRTFLESFEKLNGSLKISPITFISREKSRNITYGLDLSNERTEKYELNLSYNYTDQVVASSFDTPKVE